LDTFETRIESVKWDGDVLPALRKVFEPPCNVVPHAVLDTQMAWIVRHFDKRSTVERIVATLKQDLARDELAEILQVHVPGHELRERVDDRDDRLREIVV
ncbi:hypothetical protein SB778_38295, partial [Paraburkholderia sp. SIMBA_050]